MSTEQRLQRLEDIESIKQLIARYAKAADHNGDPDMVRPLFTEDAVWNAEGLAHWETRDGIVQGMREPSPRIAFCSLVDSERTSPDSSSAEVQPRSGTRNSGS